MARPLRLFFENAVYHITARGNRKDNIFYSDRDKSVFVDKINETFEKYSFICYAYCLMGNHYHLFIKTPLANITEGMHYLNASYCNWFKAKYKIVGVIFQGRYKSILVDEDSYALTLSGYIHLNPLRAGIVKNMGEYKWSSFLDYIGARKPIIKRLDTLFILNQFDNDLNKAAKKYKKFVLENMDMKNPFENTYKGVALGSKAFIEEIRMKIKSGGQKREIRETNIIESHKAEEIINKISELFRIKKGEVFSKRRGNIYRQLALYLTKRYAVLSLKEIGELFGMDYAAVSQAVNRFEDRIKRDRKILSMKERILKELEKHNVKC